MPDPCKVIRDLITNLDSTYQPVGPVELIFALLEELLHNVEQCSAQTRCLRAESKFFLETHTVSIAGAIMITRRWIAWSSS